jgi:hypothetical protein
MLSDAIAVFLPSLNYTAQEQEAAHILQKPHTILLNVK